MKTKLFIYYKKKEAPDTFFLLIVFIIGLAKNIDYLNGEILLFQ